MPEHAGEEFESGRMMVVRPVDSITLHENQSGCTGTREAMPVGCAGTPYKVPLSE